jgi:two-component system sensor kinase FixL
MFSSLLRGSPRVVLLRAALMIAVIALVDWSIKANVPLGFLYLFPMLLVGSATNRWTIAVSGLVCTVLTEAYDTFEWSAEAGIPRDILYFAAFFCMGLFVYEVGRSRKLAMQHLDQIEGEIEARRDAEEQLKVLVESSPAAIFTTDAEGVVLLANDAAHRLFGVAADSLPGQAIRRYLPALENVSAQRENRQLFRTVMQCRGQRQDGEVFLADVWFSTYRTSAGSRLAGMVVDASEELRTREESSLHQLLTGSRILIGAVSHEIRNVCGAIAVVHQNLTRTGGLEQNKDFEALGTLILALEKIAAMELRQTANQASEVDLYGILEELRIVIELAMRQNGVSVEWQIEADLPPVWADRQSLMQVFLNLAKNSERAMMHRSIQNLTVTASRDGNRVLVRFRDSGSGVTHPERLFRPFQQGAQATGLGLYLSREFMRSFRGDLRFEAEHDGASFIVDMAAAHVDPGERGYESADPTVIGGRSQPVSGEPQPASPSRA